MKHKYLLLQVLPHDHSQYQYPDIDFKSHYSVGNDYFKMTFRTRQGAIKAVRQMNAGARKYAALYTSYPFKWSWDHMSAHEEYREYIYKVEQWKKEQKRVKSLPASQQSKMPPDPKPRPPQGTVTRQAQAVNAAVATPSYSGTTPKYITYNTMSTPDQYDALALKISVLEASLAVMEKGLNSLAEICDEEMEEQKKAIIALGGIIKGMDDRIEDLEHKEILTK